MPSDLSHSILHLPFVLFFPSHGLHSSLRVELPETPYVPEKYQQLLHTHTRVHSHTHTRGHTYGHTHHTYTHHTYTLTYSTPHTYIRTIHIHTVTHTTHILYTRTLTYRHVPHPPYIRTLTYSFTHTPPPHIHTHTPHTPVHTHILSYTHRTIVLTGPGPVTCGGIRVRSACVAP